MSSFTHPLIRRRPVWALLLSVCLFWGGSMRVKGDADMNVTKAVWKSLYGVTDAQINDAAWLGRDDDGDGMSNAAEIIAGTHPFRAGSVLKVSSMNLNGGMVNVAIPTQNGKLYTLQVSPSLTGGSWTPLTPNVQIVGNGSLQTLSGTASGSSSFYRVLVQDVDSASDQVGDWAKKVLGYATGTPIDSQSSYDHTQLAASLQSQNVVSMTAVDATTTQPADAATPAGDVGVITVRRSGYNLLMPITVPLTKTGSAVEGTDFAAIPAAVTFPAGVNSVDIKITPLYNASRLTSCVVTLTAGAPGSAGASGNYTLSPLSISAGVTISPSGNPTGTGLTGTYWAGSSSIYASPVNFGPTTVSYTYTKLTATTGSAVITYTGTGFATNGKVNLTFSAGSLAGGTYDGIKIISATSGSTFTVPIAGAAVPSSQSGSAACLLNPPLLSKLEPNVAFSWQYGSPNGTNLVGVDNYSVAWDGYISPSTAGTYVFQLDADDRARVFLDTGSGMTQILENGWDSTATGAFKQSGSFTLAVPAAPANRYHIRVELAETTGSAKCKLQWQINGGTFANIPSTNVFTNNSGTTAGWFASYYANSNVTTSAGTQTDPAITTVNNGDWGAGTPNGTTLVGPDFNSVSWDGYLSPSTAGAYTFQLDADDRARVFLDTGSGMTQILENGWDTTATGTFKQSGSYTLAVPAAPANRYHIRVEFVETTGSAKCKFQWQINGGGFVNIPSTNIFTNNTDATTGWSGSYSTNANLAMLAGTQTDSAITNVANGDWGTGTPNGTNLVTSDYASVNWDGYLAPSTAGTYVFQLDADDKARVLLDTGSGLTQILENGWDTTATGGFKQSGQFTLAVPAAPANRYHIRVEFVETTGNARCKFQWQVNGGGFVNIPSANVFTNNSGATAGWTGSYSGQSTLVGAQTDSAITNGNNGDWGTGSPDPLVPHNNFCCRWTGQILPQYSETYTIIVNVDDMARLWINGQPMTLRRLTNDNPTVTYNYTQQSSTNGTVVLPYTSAAINVGDVIPLKFTSGNLNTSSFNISKPYTVTAVTAGVNFTVALTGSGMPASGTGNCSIDTTNLPIDWIGSSIDRYTTIALQAGVLYDIKLESCELTGAAAATLSWFSPSQSKQAIPTARLFPTMTGQTPLAGSAPAGPPAITSATNVVTMLNSGSPFSLTLTANNGAGTFSASGLPAWLTLTNGVLSGTPTQAGIFQFTVSATNSAGSTSAVITVQVEDSGAQLTRELWTTGVTGATLLDVPWNAAPTTTDTVTSAEDNTTTYGSNTGERLRGYFTPTATGNYYFWLSAANSAELWISNNSEPVNKVRRAYVTGPTGTATRTWNTAASQKSGWLALTAGQAYYIEVLHNTGASGGANNLSVGWFLDPTGNSAAIANGSAPAAATTGGVIPGFVLSPWDNPPTIAIPGTLYVTNLQGAAGLSNITGSGGAFMRVSGSTAVVHLNYSGLTSGSISRGIYAAQSGGNPVMLFDFNAQDRNYPTQRTSDGGYTWNMQAADLAALNNGTVFVSIGTTNNPSGELSGTFGAVSGSQTAPALPSYPTPTDDHASDAGAVRFLTQATFGPSPADINSVQTSGYRSWIEAQFGLSATHNVPYILSNLSSDPQNPYNSSLFFNSWWKNSVTAPDQLRQRVAFALSEILVVSDTGPLNNNGRILADYYDNLVDSCFGNYRDILKQVTLTPAMGIYLDMLANDIGNDSTGIHPNENYAREIMQLFSIGLYRLWPDGSLVLDSSGTAVPTYDQTAITGMARVFTGWTWGQALNNGRLPTTFSPSSNYLDPMVLVPTHHEPGRKALLDNVVIPPAVVTFINDSSRDPNPNAITIQTTDPVLGPGNLVTTSITNSYDLNGLRDLETALDNIINNSAVGPYICRQLIQRLVTSNPKPDYVHRVVRAFNGERNVDGVATGVRGDMKEVVRAILLDYEARSSSAAADPGFGKQREPLLRLTGPARTFAAAGIAGSTYRQIGYQQILIGTPTAHKLTNGDTILLDTFVDAGALTTNLPTTGGYSVANITPSYSTISSTGVVTVNAPGFQAGDSVKIQFTSGTLGTTSPYSTVQTYSVASATATSFTINIGANSVSGNPSGNVFLPNNFTVNTTGISTPNYNGVTNTVTITASGYFAGHQLYVKFYSGGLAGGTYDGIYTITSATASTFTVTLTGSPPATSSGVAYIPRFTGGYNITNSGGASTISVQTSGNHNLKAGDQVWIDILVANAGTPAPSQVYTVASAPLPNLFTVTITPAVSAGSQSTSGQVVYPLSIAQWTRSGTCAMQLGTWNMGYSQSDLTQTPLNSTTVFNYFYPDYHYPGEMAKAGMTTPEFQLTNDSNTMNLTNVITGGFLSGGNTNGFQSFRSGGGAVPMDISPFMTAGQTSNAGVPALVDTLATRLIGGSLNTTARTAIINYVANTTNFPYTTPTTTQMRDRVRAIIHLIVTSAEYAIQK